VEGQAGSRIEASARVEAHETIEIEEAARQPQLGCRAAPP
jgi:hypothetical protein